MRRILLVVAMAAVAVGVATPADAFTTSCTRPVVVEGVRTVGVDLDLTSGSTKVCIHQGAATRYEIGGSAVTYTYGLSGAMGGVTGQFCWHQGATYTCAAAGFGTGGFTTLPWGDAASVFLVPSVCTADHASPYAHCFGVFVFGGADGPVFGPLGGAGGGVFVCEDDGYWFYCPVMLSEWVP